MEKELLNESRSQYIPGVCNIGSKERKARRLVGWIGTAITLLLLLTLELLHTPQIYRLFIALPASLAATGFLQSAFHFCAGYGARGLFNFGNELGKADTVKEAEFRKKDLQKANYIGLLSLIIGVVAAGAAFLIKI